MLFLVHLDVHKLTLIASLYLSWKIVEELGSRKVHAQGGQGMTTVGAVTTSCSPETYCKSCTAILVDLPGEISRSNISNKDSSGRIMPAGYRPWGVKWGKYSHPYQGKCTCFLSKNSSAFILIHAI